MADLRQNNKKSNAARLADPEDCDLGEIFGRGSEEQHLRVLSSTIESEIIPRLLLLHRNGESHRVMGASEGRPEALPSRVRRPLAEEIDDFARLVVAHDVPQICSHLASVRNRGVSLEAVCLELLAPTARRLGEWWEEDLCDFTQVTVGLWRLQQVLHALSPPVDSEQAVFQPQGRILLAPAPGDNHTFGLIMVADFFRRAGWYVCDNAGPSTTELVSVVRDEFFDVIGISVGCVERFDILTTTIAALRRGSRNRQVRVMVGGAPFAGRPERAREVGADATAMDASQAPTEAKVLMQRAGKAADR